MAGTAVSTPGTPPTTTSLSGLIAWCCIVIGNNTSDTTTALSAYGNQSQKDWEMEFPDHNSLQKSQLVTFTAPVAGVGQDTCYHFTDTAPDFRKERLIRIVSPIQLSHPMKFMEYVAFRTSMTDITLTTTGMPMIWYWAPEDPSGFHIWPLPDQAYTGQFDYVAYAPELLQPGDVPFMDREFHKSLCFQMLFYYYNSEAVNMPDKGIMWGQKFEIEKRKYKKDQQRRQLQNIRMPYGTGVNESRNTSGQIYFH